MKLIGASASDAEAVTDALLGASHRQLPAFVWCDGADVVGVIGDAGDTVADVLSMVQRFVLGDAP